MTSLELPLFMHLIQYISEEPKNATELSKAIDATYSCTLKILNTFRDAGICTMEREGRVNSIIITKKGTEIRELASLIIGYLKDE